VPSRYCSLISAEVQGGSRASSLDGWSPALLYCGSSGALAPPFLGLAGIFPERADGLSVASRASWLISTTRSSVYSLRELKEKHGYEVCLSGSYAGGIITPIFALSQLEK